MANSPRKIAKKSKPSLKYEATGGRKTAGTAKTGSGSKAAGRLKAAGSNKAAQRSKNAGRSRGARKTAQAATARFAEQARTVLPGSERAAVAEAVRVRATPAVATMTVSVIVKRRRPLVKDARGPVRVSRAEFAKNHAADPEALSAVRAFAREYGLKAESNAALALRRTVKLTGTAAQMQKAFGVTLEQKLIAGVEYRVREGAIRLPASLLGWVEAVLGLDNRPQAKPHFRMRRARADGDVAASAAEAKEAAPASYTPPQVAEAYKFPAGASGAGQTIGIIELGGGYRQTDLTAYFKSLGLAAPGIAAVAVNGGKNAPSNANSADGEVMLDIEVAASVAPGARIAVYFTPNTDQGFLDAITTAVHDTTNKPSVISISWGGPEAAWTGQSMTAIDAACQSAAALGVTITVAAGDNGSSDGATGNNVDFPGSSPHVLCCGGTKLETKGATIVSEVVWNEDASNEGATGGGVSTVFALPVWQADAKVPAAATRTGGRGVPDVAGDADPETGYTVRVDGETSVIGGTSAVAPLWAGLVAVANAQLGTQVGFLQPAIYAAKAAGAFNDITQGNNGAFAAGPGWDACTGLGSPIAGKLIGLLAPAGTTTKKAAKKKSGAKKAGKKTAPKKAVKKGTTKRTAKKKRAVR